MQPISIPAAGGARHLAGALFAPAAAGPRPGLIFLHGLDADQFGYQIRARAVLDALGIVCLTFDLSGHGGSGGDLDELTPRDHVDDVVAAYDLLAAQPAVDPARIGVCGASYGGFLAAMLIGHRAVRRLLIRAPGLYVDGRHDQPLRDRPLSDVDVAGATAVRNLARFGGEVMIVESAADEVIPPEVIAGYLQAQPRARHVTMAGATHQLADAGSRQRFLDLIIEFFAEL